VFSSSLQDDRFTYRKNFAGELARQPECGPRIGDHLFHAAAILGLQSREHPNRAAASDGVRRSVMALVVLSFAALHAFQIGGANSQDAVREWVIVRRRQDAALNPRR
jgi:hypothetical protein